MIVIIMDIIIVGVLEEQLMVYHKKNPENLSVYYKFYHLPAQWYHRVHDAGAVKTHDT